MVCWTWNVRAVPASSNLLTPSNLSNSHAHHGDGVDFDARVPWQARRLNRRSRRVGLHEKCSIYVVHRSEVIHVGEKHSGTHDVRVRQPAAFEESTDIFEDALSLRFDVAVDHVAGRRVERDLSGDEQKGIG